MLLVIVIGAAAIILASMATRPVGFMLGLIQTLSFLGLVFGLVGWFVILPDPTFLWYIAVGGAVWLMVTVLRHRMAV
ncbi:hypothetical protein [uncultured Citricoccus sp.]|uniref:hypothetical protein n=1 Tax=uncultured Citricoccus sp. TaxID=614031 RepID=UPI00261A8D45|nr:hypothetical protein [uncultured Citricoccus sp.]